MLARDEERLIVYGEERILVLADLDQYTCRFSPISAEVGAQLQHCELPYAAQIRFEESTRDCEVKVGDSGPNVIDVPVSSLLGSYRTGMQVANARAVVTLKLASVMVSRPLAFTMTTQEELARRAAVSIAGDITLGISDNRRWSTRRGGCILSISTSTQSLLNACRMELGASLRLVGGEEKASVHLDRKEESGGGGAGRVVYSGSVSRELLPDVILKVLNSNLYVFANKSQV